MSAKHTPGPWSAVKATSPLAHGIWHVLIGSVSTGVRVIEIGQSAANARLIAAAPELLEALEQLQLEAWHFLESGHGRPHLETAIKVARAARAKAKGET